MHKIITIIAALALAGCASEGDKAAEEYRIAEKHSIYPAEKCAAARRARDAYLREGDEYNYKLWSSIAGACR
jgi:uncharacterized lipoprotein YmbA